MEILLHDNTYGFFVARVGLMDDLTKKNPGSAGVRNLILL